jgi:hypothetical protein
MAQGMRTGGDVGTGTPIAARFGAVLRHAPAKVRDRFSIDTPFIKLSVINADFRVGGCTLMEGLFRYKQYFRAKGYKRYEKIWDVPTKIRT